MIMHGSYKPINAGMLQTYVKPKHPFTNKLLNEAGSKSSLLLQ
jgi:hypothetical protein